MMCILKRDSLTLLLNSTFISLSLVATLGIVELFIFLLLKYYEDIDKARKEVFGDVHFALFYTAILNAFQSVLVAIVTRRASSKLWVRTEHLELDHYVEIREEFERVQQEYNDTGPTSSDKDSSDNRRFSQRASVLWNDSWRHG